MDFITFIIVYRGYLIVTLIGVWILYVLHHRGKLKLKKPQWIRRPSFIAKTPDEQRIGTAEAKAQKLEKEVERYTLAIAKIEHSQMEKEIVAQADEQTASILPESLTLFDPDNQLTGRPIYLLGNVPVINKKQALEQLVAKHPLSKLHMFENLTKRLIDWLYFQGDTAFFYSAQLLPNGKWVITATSKPSKIKGKFIRLPRYCKQFVLLTSAHQKIDDLIVNMWEVTHAKAAIELSTTIFGPFPIEQYAKVHANTGWLPE
jgi:hypothetical protein